MASKNYFGGKRIFEPGAYSQILSGISNPPLNLSYGNVLVIDTGSGASFGGGFGIDGNGGSGVDAFKSLATLKEAQNLIKGGLWWKLSELLFKPAGPGINGVSRLIYVRAAETTQASKTLTFVGGGANGGEIALKTKDEGEIANGEADTVDTNILRKGYGVIMEGNSDNTKYKLIFKLGTYRGKDSNGVEYFKPKEESPEQILVETPWFNNISELDSFFKSSSVFNRYFSVVVTVNGDGSVDSADLANYSNLNLFAGGTESYTAAALDAVLESAKELNFSFIFSDEKAGTSKSVNQTTIFNSLSEFPFNYFVFCAGSDYIGTDSETLAMDINTPYGIVSHGGFKEFQSSGVDIIRSSLFGAAQRLGRLAGLPPEIPLTFKTIPIDAELAPLTPTERESALDHGVLHLKKDNELGIIVNQGINSLQRNSNQVNEDGTSYEISIMRIAEQLNKEIIVNAKLEFFTQEEGVNRSTVSPTDVKKFTEKFLKARTATDNSSNLILGYETVTVDVDENGDYQINYGFYPNLPVNKLFFTGTMLRPNF